MDTKIYCVGFSDGLVKIGRTTDMKRRLTEYRRQSRPFLVEVSSAWTSPPVDDAPGVEARLTRSISAIATCTSGLEWFRGASITEVVRIAEAAIGPGNLVTYAVDVTPAWNGDIMFIHLSTGNRARVIDADGEGLRIVVSEGEDSYSTTVHPDELCLASRSGHGWRGRN